VDPFGHGTHVAGMIMDKQGKSDARYRSVAKGVRLIGMRVLDENGSGYTSTVIQAIDFAVRNRQQLAIDVINLSLGHVVLEPAATDPLVQAVERAVRAGIVVVVAAGNHGTNAETGATGYAGITSPGNAPSAITVGAVDTHNTLTRTDDQVAPFSSRGPTWYDAYAKPDIVAPGRRVVSFMAKKSPLYLGYPQYRVDVATRTYMTLSGTSMAASVTTGVVAPHDRGEPSHECFAGGTEPERRQGHPSILGGPTPRRGPAHPRGGIAERRRRSGPGRVDRPHTATWGLVAHYRRDARHATFQRRDAGLVATRPLGRERARRRARVRA
jgi:hypothetical protein